MSATILRSQINTFSKIKQKQVYVLSSIAKFMLPKTHMGIFQQNDPILNINRNFVLNELILMNR